MKLKAYIPEWQQRAQSWLFERDLLCSDVTTGVDAWTVAHSTGITREAYSIDRSVVDAHIQTALKQIFPNAVFKDRPHY